MNHPNRDWRKRARLAFEVWWVAPQPPFTAIREMLQNAFIAGFDAGRKPPERKP